MSRPRTISNETILNEVRAILRERGAAFTTAEVARRAGVSEGTIFKRFVNKDRLLLAALPGSIPSDRLMSLDKKVGRGAVSDNLESVVRQLIEVFRRIVPVVVAVAGTRGLLPQPPKCMHGPDSLQSQNVAVLIDYVSKEMDQGRIAPGDPKMVARILTATTWNYVFHETVGGEVYPPVDSDTFARQLVDSLWKGLDPSLAALRKGA